MPGSAFSSRRRPARRPADPLWGDLLIYLVSAVFAVVTVRLSTLSPHRAWGAVAFWGYSASAAMVVLQLLLNRPWVDRNRSCPPAGDRLITGLRARAVITATTWITVVGVPLAGQAIWRASGRTGFAQSEVLVVETAGRRLLEDGTPYLDRIAIATLHPNEQVLAYTPYHPGMAVFGMPRVLFRSAWWTDARVWFALVTIAALVGTIFVLADRLGHAGGANRLLRIIQATTVLPTCALTLATGGDDLPVLALCLLAMTFATRDRFLAAGLAVGAAASLKLTALPVAVALLALAATRRRPAARVFCCGAFGLPALVLLPAVLVNPAALAENVLRFPTGFGARLTPARSPLPGQLLASLLPCGRAVALGLLAVLAVLLAVRLVVKPPRDACAVALFCATGLGAAIALLPSTRFGYFLYPVAYAFAIPALRARSPASRLSIK
ncbi:MAG: DUF2029 domain-containing protein [Micromonosporaceae bacterium]|nr:DUF2029 domain-containing protein [Micromonosporaceae bacterium]